MVDKLKAGTSLNDVAAAEGLTVQTTFGMKRAGNAASMPPTRGRTRCSRRPRTARAAREGKDATERIVFHVTDITVPGFDAASRKESVSRTPRAAR